ncbi:MAG: ABC-type metal ion transporter, periplasmic subunit [Candidatus Magasanikbacteria bacterium GW2011_GWA2_45_39]|uniref:ABC-type metal ion transporter, periplasmic subunit n=2 Tax=Candidatus Magasanikiibacteriota TaxID=1752731 RepID=A0A0G1N175_9BACT|nr:MAG: ABC-type metal ion transporter, periplasmic subunit [Candidatus Magasanikbacteria bacterium GW2011_GWA2_45_39]KKU14239.1 MAG: ABC-type metal ion transporter, periplasmic subunit [Candidatus Magasanikbacteria bacterium GW2011_GWC2_45_8]HBW73766.1 hypothetical protein [Candidatus Magasanikbacteria bacterium]
MKKIIISVVALAVIIGLAVLYKQRAPISGFSKSGGVKIVTSIYPLEEIARNVGGEKANVIRITPNGVEPHDYEPTPEDIATLQSAQLVLVNGAGMESWSEKIKPDLEKQGVKVLNLTQTISLSDMIANSKGQIDPHIWLNPQIFQKEIDAVRDALISLNRSNASVYTENAKRYSMEIATLDAQISEGLKSCALNDFITTHDAFEYLAMRYHLTPHGIVGFSPDEEPTPRAIAELSTLARKQKIKHILVEPLGNDKFAKTLAKEAGAQTLTLNPIEGLTADETKQGATYQTLMKKNLDTLRTALSCK